MKRADLNKNLLKFNINPNEYYAVEDGSQGNLSYPDDDVFLVERLYSSDVVVCYLERGEKRKLAQVKSLEEAYQFLWEEFLNNREAAIVSCICDKTGLYERGIANDANLREYAAERFFIPTRYITEKSGDKNLINERIEAVKELMKKENFQK